MNSQITNELENIKQTIINTVETDSIYLFGNGIPSEDSDFDLYGHNSFPLAIVMMEKGQQG